MGLGEAWRNELGKGDWRVAAKTQMWTLLKGRRSREDPGEGSRVTHYASWSWILSISKHGALLTFRSDLLQGIQILVQS